jgi:hypothetical protein
MKTIILAAAAAQSSGTTNVPASSRSTPDAGTYVPSASGNGTGSNGPTTGIRPPHSTSGNTTGAVTPDTPNGSPSTTGASQPGNEIDNQTRPISGTGKAGGGSK